MRLPIADRFNHGWLAAWLALALLWVAHALTGLLAPLEQWWAEQGMARPATGTHAEIVLVAIDDASLAAVGTWPWSREVHARLIDRLTAAQARLVVHTTPFVRAEARDALAQLKLIANTVATDPMLAEHPQLGGLLQQSQDLLDGDGRLALSVAQNGRTVLAVAESADGRIDWPLAQLSSAALGVGRQVWQPDDDGRVRSMPLRSRADGRELPSLALWIAASRMGRHPAELSWQGSKRVVLGEHRWPVDRAGNVRPPWRSAQARPALFERYSASQVLAGQVPPSRLAGRTVLIGTSSSLLETPAAVAGAGMLTHLEMLAQASSALLGDQLIEQPEWTPYLEAACMVAIALFLALAMPRLALGSAAALALLASTALLMGSYLAMSRWLIAIPVMLPVAALWLGFATWGLIRRRVRTGPATSGIDPRSGGQPSPLIDTHDQAPPLDVHPGPGPAELTPVSLASLPEVSGERFGARTDPVDIERDCLPVAPRAPAAAPAQAPTPRRRLPQLGGFQLIREIGRGAMGRVYLARQAGRQREVAIKTLALAREFDGFALHEARSRFQREALAALRLRHPDIVQVYDAGEDQGYAWIAMELLTGHDLLRHTHTSALLPVPEVLEICARVAGALAHAHAQGVIHRDIKPANVMVDPLRGMVKVTDFGIARITDAARTRTGLVLGSPSYMSPEQLAGRPVDGRSDIYSLGVLLFQLLTGSLPAEGRSMAELMHAVAHLPAPDVRTLRPRVPELVANVVALALEKRVELRYGSAQALHCDLQSVLSLWALPARGASAPRGSCGSVQEVSRSRTPRAEDAMDPIPIMQNEAH